VQTHFPSGDGSNLGVGLLLAPFRGVRYDLSKVGGLANVTSPPYDVIGPETLERLLAASPYNVVRLILPSAGAGNPTASAGSIEASAGSIEREPKARAAVFGLRSDGARDERRSDEGENGGYSAPEASAERQRSETVAMRGQLPAYAGERAPTSNDPHRKPRRVVMRF
jgi:Protein of unknown function (DUF1015)